ncbi:kinase-like domain-containing protein [Rhodocollybia butyracea]|uniref:Kinase-like domain-containing protein n=1 Tax=Rhodocollybia butyracea TaxID=206335 RepID=A0A9P5Q1N8_9AGAR|nr:kinase-like domain-containing protein [Rhodocollybia butyracea]
MSDSVDVEVLKQRIQNRLNDQCESLEEHIQGSHHRTYIAQMTHGGKRLVRVESIYLRRKDSGCGISSPYKMSSEVATIRFLKQHSTIPVPFIYWYDDDTDGRVGGKWMIMEYLNGSRGDQIWSTLTGAQREKLVLSLADIWARLMQHSFQKIGSLYECADGTHFYVGRMTFLPTANHYAIAPPDANKCGPFSTAQAWLEASARQELAYKIALPHPLDASSRLSRISAVLDLIRRSRDLQICTPWNASQLCMEHVDFSTHNILVSHEDPTRIVAVLDWEGARIVPMWAMNPAFRWPRSDETEISHLKNLMRRRICAQVAGWEDATSDVCRNLRILTLRAALSDRDPEIIPECPILTMS